MSKSDSQITLVLKLAKDCTLFGEFYDKAVIKEVNLNRCSFIGYPLIRFTLPYRTRRAVNRSSLRHRLAVCFLLVQANVYC